MSRYSKQLVEQCYGPEAIHEQIHFIELIHNYENKYLTFYYARTYFLVGSKVTQPSSPFTTRAKEVWFRLKWNILLFSLNDDNLYNYQTSNYQLQLHWLSFSRQVEEGR